MLSEKFPHPSCAVYSHGGDIYSGPPIRLDFSVNTTPLGIPPAVLRAVASCREEILLYPDSQCRKLKKALADHWTKRLRGAAKRRPGFNGAANGPQPGGVSMEPSKIICGNGAADLIFGLAEALRPRRAILFAPCFSEYETALSLKGCEIVRIPLRPEERWLPSLRRLSKAFDRSGGADLVFLGNPNNPTGMALTAEELEPFAKLCESRGAVLAVDECFNGFLREPENYTAMGLTGSCGNLFVLNAFTKTYGMAGLRLGYAVCGDERLLERIAAVRQPWSVSGVAQKAGIAALSETEFVRQARELVEQERPFLSEGLARLGFTVYPSMVNYLLFSDPEMGRRPDERDLKAFLMEQGILIRSCADYQGLDKSFYRTAVKTRRENEELLRAAAQWRKAEEK